MEERLVPGHVAHVQGVHVVEGEVLVAAAEDVQVHPDERHRVPVPWRRRRAKALRLRPRQGKEERLVIFATPS